VQNRSFEALFFSTSGQTPNDDDTIESDRKNKLDQIKKRIEDETYLTHEKLDRALLNLLEEVEHE
jgi:hypothetical protein